MLSLLKLLDEFYTHHSCVNIMLRDWLLQSLQMVIFNQNSIVYTEHSVYIFDTALTHD